MKEGTTKEGFSLPSYLRKILAAPFHPFVVKAARAEAGPRTHRPAGCLDLCGGARLWVGVQWCWTGSEGPSLQLDSVCTDEELDLKGGVLEKHL